MAQNRRIPLGPMAYLVDTGSAPDEVLSAAKCYAQFPSKNTIIIPYTISIGQTWTDMPASATIYGGSGNNIQAADLTLASQARLCVRFGSVPGVAGSKLIAKYSANYTQTAASYSDLGVSEISVPADNGANSYFKSAWIDIAALARADVFITVIGTGGDGVTDPTFGNVKIEIR